MINHPRGSRPSPFRPELRNVSLDSMMDLDPSLRASTVTSRPWPERINPVPGPGGTSPSPWQPAARTVTVTGAAAEKWRT
jgi:hypothetical protein